MAATFRESLVRPESPQQAEGLPHFERFDVTTYVWIYEW